MILRLEATGHSLEIPPTEAKAVIGRSDDCDYVVNDNSVSRKHLEVYFRANNGWTIRDLDSSKGTYVNNIRKKEPVELKFGDTVKLGEVVFTVHFKGSENEAPIPTKIRTHVLAEGGAKALVMTQRGNVEVDMGKPGSEAETRSVERRKDRAEDTNSGGPKPLMIALLVLAALLFMGLGYKLMTPEKQPVLIPKELPAPKDVPASAPAATQAK